MQTNKSHTKSKLFSCQVYFTQTKGIFNSFCSQPNLHTRKNHECKFSCLFNTSYLTDSYISFTLKLESRQNFCSNRSVRSSTYGKKKYCWNSSMRKPFSSNSFYLLVLRKITNSVTKRTIFPHGEKLEIFFLPYVLDLIDLLEQNFYRDSNLRVKMMYESVK